MSLHAAPSLCVLTHRSLMQLLCIPTLAMAQASESKNTNDLFKGIALIGQSRAFSAMSYATSVCDCVGHRSSFDFEHISTSLGDRRLPCVFKAGAEEPVSAAFASFSEDQDVLPPDSLSACQFGRVRRS